jgi:hypothetical protein
MMFETNPHTSRSTALYRRWVSSSLTTPDLPLHVRTGFLDVGASHGLPEGVRWRVLEAVRPLDAYREPGSAPIEPQMRAKVWSATPERPRMSPNFSTFLRFLVGRHPSPLPVPDLAPRPDAPTRGTRHLVGQWHLKRRLVDIPESHPHAVRQWRSIGNRGLGTWPPWSQLEPLGLCARIRRRRLAAIDSSDKAPDLASTAAPR